MLLLSYPIHKFMGKEIKRDDVGGGGEFFCFKVGKIMMGGGGRRFNM